MTSPRMTVALSVLSIALTVAPAWALLVLMGGDWSLTRFTLSCAGMAPVSAALHHVFRLGDDREALSHRWRQLKATLVGLGIALVASALVRNQDPIMTFLAFVGTTVAYGLMHVAAMELRRRSPNSSLERTREE
jgi:hypothetical protein